MTFVDPTLFVRVPVRQTGAEEDLLPDRSLSDAQVQAKYIKWLNGKLEPYLGSSLEKPVFKQVLASFRAEFLSVYNWFVPDGPVRVDFDFPSGKVTVVANIINRLEQERRKAHTERAIAAAQHAHASHQKSLRSMYKRLAKLEAKHGVPHQAKSIWSSLTSYQKYAMLKDLDYDFRHNKKG